MSDITDDEEKICLKLVGVESIELSELAADFTYGTVLGLLNKLGARDSSPPHAKIKELSVTVAVGRHPCRILIK